jgi:hypothetical protein
MMYLNQPIPRQHSIEIHTRELERKTEGKKLEKLKARLKAKVQEQKNGFILARAC